MRFNFYRAMRGIAIACRLSVCLFVCLCPSVTLVDQEHIGWKSWKLMIIARTNLVLSQERATLNNASQGLSD